MGIRSIGWLLNISKSTVIRRIRKISATITPLLLFKPKLIYEMDEVHTFIGSKAKECWIAYAIERLTGKVVDFRIGTRTLKTLRPVI
jgi:hypothetical protein